MPDGTKIAEVADLDFDGDARAAALDLSLADGRFAPDVLEVAARRAVAAWAEAVDGDDSELEGDRRPRRRPATCCTPATRAAPTRLVVRGPQVEQIRIAALDAGAEPPTMTIEVEHQGPALPRGPRHGGGRRRQRVARDQFTEHWTLALDGDADAAVADRRGRRRRVATRLERRPDRPRRRRRR